LTDGTGGNRHSDKEKFRGDLNRPESCEMSERLLKTLRNSRDFRADTMVRFPQGDAPQAPEVANTTTL